jgi:hypothetical protein
MLLDLLFIGNCVFKRSLIKIDKLVLRRKLIFHLQNQRLKLNQNLNEENKRRHRSNLKRLSMKTNSLPNQRYKADHLKTKDKSTD